MATYTFELSNDLTIQEIDDYAKVHNIDIAKLLSDTISTMLKGKKSIADESTDLEIQKIRALAGKYAHLNPHKKPVSIEEMDRIAKEEFAKKWAENERYNYSND